MYATLKRRPITVLSERGMMMEIRRTNPDHPPFTILLADRHRVRVPSEIVQLKYRHVSLYAIVCITSGYVRMKALLATA